MRGKRKTADETFLADQLERMRHLVEQLTLAHGCVAGDSDVILPSRDAAIAGPLESVRDYRTYEPHPDEPERVRTRGGPVADSVRHDSSVRKRRC